MQRAPVRFSEEAVVDLEDIFFLLLQNGASIDVGLHYVERLRQRCQRIGDVPEGYPLRPMLGAGIRILPFERSATIAYRLVDHSVEVVRVFYGGQDYDLSDLLG